MDNIFVTVDRVLADRVGRVAPAAQLCVHQYGRVIFSRAYGWLDPGTQRQPANGETLFDLASITKLFTTTVFMTLVEASRVSLDQPVCSVLPAFSGLRPIQPYEDPLNWSGMVDVSSGAQGQVDASQITFRNLLIHNSGLPAWRPFESTPNAAAAKQMALSTFFAYPTGTRVIYSDVGLILLGMAVEALTGQRLDEAVRQVVTGPLELRHTRFLPVPNADRDNIAPTEFCQWRKQRVLGEVHDENAWRLGGIAGHAGLFSNAEDLARFGQMYLEGGAPLLKPETVAEMVRLQSQEGATRRGVGFHLWSPDPEASSHPFSPQTYGHTGFTGTCLWIDPQRALVVALLTNEVYQGRTNRGIGPLRLAVHEAIIAAVDSLASAVQAYESWQHRPSSLAAAGVAGPLSLAPQPRDLPLKTPPAANEVAGAPSATEARNPATLHIDVVSTLEMLKLINAEDHKVAGIVATQLPVIAEAVDQIAARMRQGGRLIYIGAGTSGRLAVVDASECPPTFSISPDRVVGLIAGGAKAITQAVEGAEDKAAGGEEDIAGLNVGVLDTVVGLAASGRTPYVLGGLHEARRRGALTVGIACNFPSLVGDAAEISIVLVVGPEVIAGSTRMKAGTAQKLVLNLISTGVMIRLGKTFGNLMVDVQPTNSKLRARARRIVAEACGISLEAASAIYEQCGHEVKTAIVAQLAGISPEEARQRLRAVNGVTRLALEEK